MESLIDGRDTPCFGVRRMTLSGARCALDQAPALYVMTGGEGELRWEGGMRPVRRGAYFFLPYSLRGKAALLTQGRLEAVCCLPPEPTPA